MVKKLHIKENLDGRVELTKNQCKDILKALNTRYVGESKNLEYIRNLLISELEGIIDGSITSNNNYKFEDTVPFLYTEELLNICRKFLTDLGTLYLNTESALTNLKTKTKYIDRK